MFFGLRTLRLLGLIWGCTTGLSFGYDDALYEQKPIYYSKTQPSDPITKLQAAIDQNTVKLPVDKTRNTLAEILKQLDIPISSQVLVFSKTSVQKNRISPAMPRAIYFNDDVYIGYVKPSTLLEVASMDPNLGAIFYTLSTDMPEKPYFYRQTHNCLQCHDGQSATLGVPGISVRSIYPDSDGEPRFDMGGFRTTYRSPFHERWGGWYVTGTHGQMRHMGNTLFEGKYDPKVLAEKNANKTSLKDMIDLNDYLTETSDIVALMTLEHQAHTHNLITRCGMETKVALLQNAEIQKMSNRPASELTPGTQSRIRSNCEPVVEALLYSGEAPLSAPVKGTSTFQTDFEKRGPFDSKQRSFRQFDLNKRMFKYPCSYLIYSAGFRNLPKEARTFIWNRLGEILSGKDQSASFKHLSTDDRANILAILRETIADLPAGFPNPAQTK